MKLIEIVASEGNVDTVSAIAEKHKVHHFRSGTEGDAQWMRLLVDDHQIQAVLDTLQGVLGAQPGARILVMPVDVALPRPTEGKETKNPAITAREALYSEVEKNARPDVNFFVLVALSTVVAAIGLIENNVAVVIGAMVIAPLLGPNLALAFGAALGDLPLMRKSLKTTAAGIGLAVGLSVVIGVIWPFDLASPELLSRTDAQLDSVALALASGAAAVLSLTTGLPSVLVGVMVAVALLPPA
nr:TIGR00341 family protein [Gammaproteobacteria bacterium]